MHEINNRQKQIVELIKKFHFMTIKQLAKILNVSEMTIRRDIPVLVKLNLANQVYGGITNINPQQAEAQYTIDQEINKNTSLKQRIAQKGVELIATDDVIFLDSGTTIQKLAEMIPEGLSCTIITHNFSALEAVVKFPNCQVICPGGVFTYKQKVFYQNETTDTFNNYRANKCFLGTTGYDIDLGLTCSYPEDVKVKTRMLEISKERILLIDSTKYDQVSTCMFAKIENFTTVITDNGTPEKYIKHIKDKGINLIIA